MSLQLIFILIFMWCDDKYNVRYFWHRCGVLMVPILYTLFPQFPLQMIAATSLTIVMGSSFINLIYFYKQKVSINYKAMLIWSMGMIIGVQLGFESSFMYPILPSSVCLLSHIFPISNSYYF